MSRVISLSTCWCSHRHSDGYEMLTEMAGLGFEYVELSHGIRITLVEGIMKAVDEGLVKLSSVHNFCPLPPQVTQAAPNFYEPTAADPRERRQWLNYTRRTLDLARRLGAPLVVIHCGSVPYLFGDPRRKLKRSQGGRTSFQLASDDAYKNTLGRVLSKLEKKAAKYMAHLRVSLGDIMPVAREMGMRLGLENREGLIELPLDRAIADFIRNLDDTGTAGYWHDVGHAHIKEQLGIIEHNQLLQDNEEQLMGFHIHDVSPEGRDHLPLGRGEVDFAMVKKFIRPEHSIIIEMGPHVKEEDVSASLKYLIELLEGQ